MAKARLFDEAVPTIREAIELGLEVDGTPDADLELVGIQRITVPDAA